MTRVALVKTRDRLTGVPRALELLGAGTLPGKHLFLKPNLNTTDPSPGSTHNDTLTALVRWLQARRRRADHGGRPQRHGQDPSGDERQGHLSFG